MQQLALLQKNNNQLNDSKSFNNNTSFSLRGAATVEKGINWENSFCEIYNNYFPNKSPNDPKNIFLKKLLSFKNINIKEIFFIYMCKVPGNKKTDAIMHIVFKNETTEQIRLQLKGVNSTTQFLKTQADTFTNILSDEYLLAKNAIQKMMGYGFYAEEAKIFGFGGTVKATNGDYKRSYRYLKEELLYEERLALKKITIDKIELEKIFKYCLLGDEDEYMPELCIFSSTDRSKNPNNIYLEDLNFFSYQDAIESMLNFPTHLNNTDVPQEKDCSKYMKKGNFARIGYKIGLLTIKINDAGKDTKDGHALQVVANPIEIYDLATRYIERKQWINQHYSVN